MGQPAARLGDTTMHGGSIVVGFPMVLIGGLPAARIGDMHVCPMLNPGTPPPPHVGGPISKGSATVLIGGMPAARQGDMCVCSGPPDTIAMGCMTVLIGDGGGGAGAGAGAGGSSSVAAAAASTEDTEIGSSQSGAGEASDETESHFLKLKFVDEGGFPITGVKYKHTDPNGNEFTGTLTGIIESQMAIPGSHTVELMAIINVRWSTASAKAGESVTMTAEAVGIDDGTAAKIELWIFDPNYSNRKLREYETEVQGGKVEAEWQIEVDGSLLEIQDEKLDQGFYSSPLYYFVVKAGDCESRSGMLQVLDDIEITLKDQDGNAIPDRRYRLFTSTGEVRQGQLDGSGSARETDVPAGRVRVAFDLKDESFSG